MLMPEDDSEKDQPENEEEIIKFCSEALYAGGADTVSLSAFPGLSPNLSTYCYDCLDRRSGDSHFLPHGRIPRHPETCARRDSLRRWRREVASVGGPGSVTLCACAHSGDSEMGLQCSRR